MGGAARRALPEVTAEEVTNELGSIKPIG